MDEIVAKLCPNEPWYAAGSRYCLIDPGALQPSFSQAISDVNAGQALVVANVETRFQPLDHCNAYTLLFATGRRCDGMVFSRSMKTIAFVELKERRHDWFNDAAEQLESTIGRFRKSDPELLLNARIRHAYIANRKARMQPRMSPSMASRLERFKADTGFRLIVDTLLEICEDSVCVSVEKVGIGG